MGWLLAGVLVLVLLVAELVAPRLAERALLRTLGPCVVAEEVAITGLSRPLLPQLVTGRARRAEVVATGVVLGELRVERVEAALTRLDLPWGLTPGEPDPPIEVTAEVTAADARALLHAITPFGLRPTLELRAGEVVIGAPGLGLDARFVPVIRPDEVALVPALGPPEWWTALGLALRTELPGGVTVESIDVGEDRVLARGQVVLAELTPAGAPVCETPLAADPADPADLADPAVPGAAAAGVAAAGGAG